MHSRLAHLQSSLARDPSLIDSTDAVGGSIVHIAYLFENYKIGRFLVQNFPEHALRGYSDRSTMSDIDPKDMPYTGVAIRELADDPLTHAYRRRRFCTCAS